MDASGDSGDRALDRATAERVLGERVRGASHTAWNRREVPVERVADDRDRGAVLRIRESQRTRGHVREAEDGDVVVDVKDNDRREVLVGVARDLDECAAFAGDDVCGGDDEVTAREPAAPLDSVAARRAEHLDDAGERRTDPRVAENAD